MELVRESQWRAWPPRLPEQPIFYPGFNEEYAVKIARGWNVKHDGAGYVTRFRSTPTRRRRPRHPRSGDQGGDCVEIAEAPCAAVAV